MYVNFDSETLRVILRVYFVLTLLLVGLVGKACCQCAVKVALYNKKPLGIHLMTGWLKGFDIFTSTWALRRLPAGLWFGLVMIVAALLSLGSDFAVTGLVKPVQLPRRCEFGQGLVVSTTGHDNFYITPGNGQPKITASNSQLISMANGGMTGVYQKVNNALNFYAQPSDIIDTWNCSDVQNDISYTFDTSQASIFNDLVIRGYLYSNYSYDATKDATGGLTTHLVVWSSSAADGDSTPFNVKVSIDLSIAKTDAKVMRSYTCALNTHALDTVLSQIYSVSTLLAWVPQLQGGVYDGSGTPAAPYAKTFIEQLLNAMTMVQGGSNYLLNTPPLGTDTTQGCLVTETDLPWVVIGLVILAGVLLLALTCQWIVLLIRLGTGATKERGMKTVLEAVPTGLVGWQLQAARESAMDRGVKLAAAAKELKRWRFEVAPRGVGSAARMVRNGDEVLEMVPIMAG